MAKTVTENTPVQIKMGKVVYVAGFLLFILVGVLVKQQIVIERILTRTEGIAQVIAAHVESDKITGAGDVLLVMRKLGADK